MLQQELAEAAGDPDELGSNIKPGCRSLKAQQARLHPESIAEVAKPI